jgi:hypothetical protein
MGRMPVSCELVTTFVDICRNESFWEMASFGPRGFLDRHQSTRSRFWAIMTHLVASSRGYPRRANASVAFGRRWAKLRVYSRLDYPLSLSRNNRRMSVLLGLSNALILLITHHRKPRDLSRKHADSASSWLDGLVGLGAKEDPDDRAAKPILHPSSASWFRPPQPLRRHCPRPYFGVTGVDKAAAPGRLVPSAISRLTGA